RGEAERSHETDCRITTLDSDEVATTRVVKVIDMQRDSIRQSEGRSPSGNKPVATKTQGAQQNSTIEHEQGGVSMVELCCAPCVFVVTGVFPLGLRPSLCQIESLCISITFNYPHGRDFVAIQCRYSTVCFVAPLGFTALNINTTNTFRDIAMSILITQYPFIPTKYDTTPTRHQRGGAHAVPRWCSVVFGWYERVLSDAE
ncbi:hypothetical protein, partial [Mycobacteroides abscessus]|uniref:hypothetical protein n=1 Tax=Mycobacteroides abscessus TaxID=36809 RepID=UPI0034E86FB9